jgi:acyl-coenzyme A thioesterase PaaI-like protein
MSALQDLYPDNYAHCYGCGRLNAHGLHVKSEWQNGAAIARFTPAAYHMAMPGFVYGGLIASLIDCHAMATAAAASMVAAGLTPGKDPTPRFVTASLQVDFIRPTPAEKELLLRGEPAQVGDRKVVVHVQVIADGVECVRGRVIAVRLPESMAAALDRGGA